MRRQRAETMPRGQRRTDEPTRLPVVVLGELTRWLRVYAATSECDVSEVVTDALAAYRRGRG